MILASNNKGKLREIKDILIDYNLKTLDEVGINIEVEEDQDSFFGNALKKATQIYNLTKEETIADDSGLCIDILENFPGVETHRFLGEKATDLERNLAIIEKLKGVSFYKRKATVVCNLVYYDGKNTILGEGILNGHISSHPKGKNGFGFDEIFMIEDGRTLAELSSDEKNKLSARYLATVDLKNKLKDLNN